MKHGVISLVVVGFGLVGLPATVSAAETSEEEPNIETVIVTATKREESIQDVPIAVSAIAGEDLAARGVQDIYGLMEVSPSVVVYNSNSTSNGGTLRIRGVGTTGNNPGLEAAVGTFIDGIYRSRAGLAFNDMTDLDRVEILRGPQGTLFGKNTVAGAVNIITRKPEFDNAFSVSAGVGNLESRELGLIANTVLSDNVLAGRLSIAHRERDGYYENVDTGAAYDNRATAGRCAHNCCGRRTTTWKCGSSWTTRTRTRTAARRLSGSTAPPAPSSRPSAATSRRSRSTARRTWASTPNPWKWLAIRGNRST